MKIKLINSLIGAIILLSFVACNEKTTTASAEKEVKTVERRNFGDSLSGIAMAFYYQDSIATQFRFYREIDSLLNAKEMAFHNELEKKYVAYQNYEKGIQERYERNEITGYQIEEIQQTMLQKQQAIQQYEQQQGTALQRESLQYQIALMNKISEAGKEFSKSRNIDLLFFYQKGGQITFINSAFDVTDDFIAFLNEREDNLRDGFETELESLEKEDLQTLEKEGGNLKRSN